MIPLLPEEIARLTGATLVGQANPLIRYICTDTRNINRPSESLFIALKGPNHDGLRYLNDAYSQGIRCFIASEIPDSFPDTGESTFLLDPDPLSVLQKLARTQRDQFGGTLLAITGSNGKTIVKEWMSQVLTGFYRVSKNPKSFNSQLGVPLSVWSVNPADDFAILEAGISKPGEMEKLRTVLNPDWGLITNIGDAHQENFTDMAQKIREKILLFRNCRTLFYCLDHSDIDKEIRNSGFPANCISWSRRLDAPLKITSELRAGNQTLLEALYLGIPVKITLPFTDLASVDNLIHVWLITLFLTIDPGLVQKQMLELEPIKMRMEQKSGINGCTLINDYYNFDILALKAALDLLFQQTHQPKKTVIFSDILQSGIPEAELYAEINQLLEGRNIHRIIGIGTAISRNHKRFNLPLKTWLSTREFINQLNPDDFHDEAILLKGARPFAFEAISNLLEAKVHTTTLEIRMEDVRQNLTRFRQDLTPGTAIMVMVKAFSYGSGGVEIARFLAHERVDYLGVAFADEGVEIRKAGISIPVMVMSPDYRQSDILINNHLEPEIYNWKGLHEFARASREEGGEPFPVHLKIDTGMHRLGFQPQEAESLGKFLIRHTEIQIQSVFSHLSASDDPAADEFSRSQISRLIVAADTLESLVKYPFKKHILNTAGIKRFPEAQFDMVRLGIGLYGYGDAPESGLRPVATLRTVISQIHELPAGEPVGYGRLTILDKPTRVAVIPIGYADGIDRRLGNGKYRMLVKGQMTPTIGNICMDMTILDITGTNASEGDEVIVFGPENPVTVMAAILGTIPYEVLTSIPARVKRIFLFD